MVAGISGTWGHSCDGRDRRGDSSSRSNGAQHPMVTTIALGATTILAGRRHVGLAKADKTRASV